MCQNTTMRVNGAGIKRYCALCSKTFNTFHSCHNFPAGSRQAARGAHICETSLLYRNILVSSPQGLIQSNSPQLNETVIETRKIFNPLKHMIYCRILAYPFNFQKSINTLRPRQNGCQFPDDSFKCICLDEKIYILVNLSLDFVPKGQINNILALIQIVAWR